MTRNAKSMMIVATIVASKCGPPAKSTPSEAGSPRAVLKKKQRLPQAHPELKYDKRDEGDHETYSHNDRRRIGRAHPHHNRLEDQLHRIVDRTTDDHGDQTHRELREIFRADSPSGLEGFHNSDNRRLDRPLHPPRNLRHRSGRQIDRRLIRIHLRLTERGISRGGCKRLRNLRARRNRLHRIARGAAGLFARRVVADAQQFAALRARKFNGHANELLARAWRRPHCAAV